MISVPEALSLALLPGMEGVPPAPRALEKPTRIHWYLDYCIYVKILRPMRVSQLRC